MRMLSHSEVLGILVFTKDAFWPHFDVFAKVTGHFVPKLFRTQVIKYLFGHFVPTNYPFRAMSFRYPFGLLISTKITNWFQNVKSGYEMTIV